MGTTSIIQTEKECYFCGRQYGLESHHCLHGTANRKQAEKYGLKVWLCNECHRELHDRNFSLDLILMQTAQQCFEEQVGDRRQFVQIFGKNFL